MQGLHRYTPFSDVGVRLELTPSASSPLAIDGVESPAERIQRLISENPVVIFSRPSCCMCHVMKTLLSSVGAHATVIEVEEEAEMEAVMVAGGGVPAVFVGGTRVGGLESMVGMHLEGELVPKLVEVGALHRGKFLRF